MTGEFKEWINKLGVVVGALVDSDGRKISGELYTDFDEEFLMWTGREFKIEVEW